MRVSVPENTPAVRDEEIEREQKQVDAAYAALDARRVHYRAEQARVQAENYASTPQNRTERDALAAHYGDEATRLAQIEDRLVFGRLDMVDGEKRYVGRIGLADDAGAKLLLDWRAPACEPFYRATAAQPLGVARRRHVLTRARRVVDLEDDLLDGTSGLDLAEVRGDGALMGALSAARSGRMNDIVATIQAEQDEVIRAPLDGVQIVQGGPGTGKTAVALHRAAYLLHTHRERLARSGVLILGPSRAFLRYIEHVLPSLGETGVVSTTLGDLLPGKRVGAVDTRAAAEVKGREVWRDILARIVRALERTLPRRQLRVGGVGIWLEPDEVRAAITRARRTGFPHNEARVKFVDVMIEQLAVRYAAALQGPKAEVDDWMRAELRSDPDVRTALNLCWMPIDVERLLARIYYHPHYLDTYAPELSEDDKARIWRPLHSELTEADIVLLDELSELVGDTPLTWTTDAEATRRAEEVAAAQAALETAGLAGGLVSAEMLADRFANLGEELTLAERARRDRRWTYGHIIVDEAQELSPLAWRAVLRRCPARSLTVVGDLAQASSLAARRSWAAALAGVETAALSEHVLTVSYRTPKRIIDAAGEVLAHLTGHAPPPMTAARDLPTALAVTPTLLTQLPDLVATELATLDADKGVEAGRLAVIAPAGQVAQTREALADFLTQATGEADLLQRVVVLTPLLAKGLEFDVVVVFDPLALATVTPADLYVAMTRPTTRLVVAHPTALPARLGDILHTGARLP
ncbi:HelD family protein [Buchananella hordeovulneris]|uniref:HelD family protein n=1 Tax=Buchananella hordeovulneris TaxID=52770 RepID=UPI000F5D9FDD|nr:AAA family ATPase [Buchananella hordeovulneris]RRD44070.1 hypothetical protein EII13_05015 [Buchananella hordeovulneris]